MVIQMTFNQGSRKGANRTMLETSME